MVKIRIGGTVDPLERMLMDLVADWDELERWMIRYGGDQSKAFMAGEEKTKLLEKIAALRNAEKEA